MLSRSDLMSLEDYSTVRTEFRRKVLDHKQQRRVKLGEHILLIFEDELSIRYQVQEMLRIEKIFEANAIQEELDAYNPLIPDGNNWKCSLLIQYEDEDERKVRLTELVGIENRIWMKVGETGKTFAIADEDMERSNETKTSAVHFMRYPLSEEQINAAKNGGSITIGIDHPGYSCAEVLVNEVVHQSLVADLS